MDCDLKKSVSGTDIKSIAVREDADTDMIAKEAVTDSSIYHW